jgi:hypothetical protein
MPASERTEIRVLYDDEALYFGAMMYDSEPDRIVARLSRRDNVIETDRASIFLDSFHDRQNGYEFTFSAAGKIDPSLRRREQGGRVVGRRLGRPRRSCQRLVGGGEDPSACCGTALGRRRRNRSGASLPAHQQGQTGG